MAKKSQILRALKPTKFKCRRVNRCTRCGRRRAFIRRFHLCRICLRELASWGLIPGVRKASW